MTVAAQQDRSGSVWARKDLAPMDAYEFRQWSELLEARTGISLPETRKSFLLSNLSIRMRELGYQRYRDYFHYVTDGRRGMVEWEILVDRLTVHETRFYRDPTALQMLREIWLDRLPAGERPHQLRVWSVGCATGEEPYSLAMLIDDALLSRGVRAYPAITATDVSAAALATGREAIYPANRLVNLPEGFRGRYFRDLGDNRYQVKDVLRERVCFARLNLLHLERTPLTPMDVIYCQNVLIYFKKPQRQRILDRLVAHLRPGGLLVLGAGEITDWSHPETAIVDYPGTLVFRRSAPRSES